MTKEEFQIEFSKLMPQAAQRMSVGKIIELIGCNRTVMYRWKKGMHAPIRIARIGIIALLKEIIGHEVRT